MRLFKSLLLFKRLQTHLANAVFTGLLMSIMLIGNCAWGHSKHAEEDPNAIIYNGNFVNVQLSGEQIDLDHWGWQCNDTARGLWKIDTATVAEDGSSVMISVNGTRASLYQILNRVPRVNFVLAGSFKKDTNLKSARIVLHVFSKNPRRHPIILPVSQTPAKVWTKFEQTFLLPADTEGLMVALEAEGQGRVWIDYISASEVKSASAN